MLGQGTSPAAPSGRPCSECRECLRKRNSALQAAAGGSRAPRAILDARRCRHEPPLPQRDERRERGGRAA
ncbi:hypothetical protein BU14_3048s0001 [Porphyra umbilicalis]|uniref:Uncharacterized protein n=1 Tax=Porphyra umbilicalis TaxID=2786 RepID=A0A1X6NIB8_PORUM|nr:hypothetical protein BU14_3048s0001 [Porphyra umbilicalis]|eukprot:OSX68302.1 hypothetical protein BU14_3048s0001 [Porphyra umbilicalis]